MKKIVVKKIAQLTGHKASIFALESGASAPYFLSGAGDGWIVQWDLREPEMGTLLAKVDANIFSLLHLLDQKTIVAGNMNGGVHWVDLENPEHTRNIAHHKKGVYASMLLDEQVITLGGSGMISRWSISERRSLESFQLTNQSLRDIAYSPTHHELAIASSDHQIYILDATTWSIKHLIRQAHENSVFSVQYSPDGHYLLSGGRDAQLKVWAIERDYELLSQQAAHWFTINAIAYHPDGHLFATASRDKTLKIWDSASFKLLKVIEGIRDGGHLNSVNRLYWSSYNNYLISCSDDRSIIIWDVA